jgi:predicted nuclease of predicted toxin-antitoxin system
LAPITNSKYLLDANLLPRVAKYLSQAFSLDVISLQGKRLGELKDPAIVDLARTSHRVIITLDEDFVDIFESSTISRRVGTIYLQLPNRLRYTKDIISILSAFFENQAESIDLDRSLVIVSDQDLVIHRPPSKN